MDLNRKIKKQIGFGALYKALAVVVSFISVPVLFNFLGKENYGIWITIASILNWFTVMDFGLGLGLRNKLSKSIAAEEIDVAKSMIISTYAIIVAIAIILFILLFALTFILDWNAILNTYFFDSQQFGHLLRLAFIGFCLSFVLQIVHNLYYAMHDASKVELLKLSRQALVFLPVLLLKKEISDYANLVKLVSINSFIPILVFIFFTLYFFKKHYYLIPTRANFSWFYGKSVMKLGGNFFILRLSSLFLITLLPFMITRFLGAEHTADFNVAYKYLGVVQLAFVVICNPYWSAVSEKYIIGDIVWIKKSLARLILYSFVGLLFILVLLLASSYVLPYWIGETLEMNKESNRWVALLVGVFLITEPFLLFLNGMGEVKIQTYYAIFVIVFVVAFDMLLLEYTSLNFGALIIPPVVFRLVRSIHAAFEIRTLLSEK